MVKFSIKKIDKFCVDEIIFYQNHINLFKPPFLIYVWVFLRKKHIKRGKIINGEYYN